MNQLSGPPCQAYFSAEHNMLRSALREFVKKEITPFVDDWERAGAFPRDLYRKMGDLGFLGIGFPEDFGGSGGDIFSTIVLNEELMRCGAAGIVAGLGSHGIGLPPIAMKGTPDQVDRFVRPVLAGEKIAALGITEPSGGSDVANLQTTAVRDGDYYIVNGSKTFITSGIRADQLTCAVRTGDKGAHGISFLVIEAGTPGYATGRKLEKMGWLASDTGEIFFDNCRVPVANRIGEENSGFYTIMENFQMERLHLCVMANMTAQLALEESIRYAKQRQAFGKPLKGFQVTRHKLVDMATLVEASREFTYRVAAKMNAGQNQVKEISMAKNFACQVSDKVTYDAVQIFGGYGYMKEYMVERLYRDNRILSIGGGTTEIMKEIIANFVVG
ncbi:MAG: acyl-CoA dehydrogenase family protein [Thermodesulfobacteriota bacterium]|nr:acyl-CoA dehydrogenase family protein [Thermodesulfobacteriota bacterium]